MTVWPKKYLPKDDGTPTTQERRIASTMGGERVRGSGSTARAKGDVRMSDFLVECKQTVHSSISITHDWLDTISKQAEAIGKEPALAIEIQGRGKDSRKLRVRDRDWILLPARVFKKLIGEE